jgi:hypothetical protein
MKKWFYWVLAFGGAYVLYQLYEKHKAENQPPEIAPETPLPVGAHLTGRIQTTTNGRPPNFVGDVVAYAVRDWAEYVRPDGQTDWVAIAKRA